jgi:hypothetical protein
MFEYVYYSHPVKPTKAVMMASSDPVPEPVRSPTESTVDFSFGYEGLTPEEKDFLIVITPLYGVVSDPGSEDGLAITVSHQVEVRSGHLQVGVVETPHTSDLELALLAAMGVGERMMAAAVYESLVWGLLPESKP